MNTETAEKAGTLNSGSRYGAIDAVAPNSRSNIFRNRRFGRFLGMIDDVLSQKDRCEILDVGGTTDYWRSRSSDLSGRNVHVTIVNFTGEKTSEPWMTAIAGDARDMSSLKDLSFDVVHSNSVIEHVGLWKDMCAMGSEVRRLAPRYFVQTPNYWFPVEPHFRAILIHWLPSPIRLFVMMRRRDYPGGKASVTAAMSRLHSTILLDRKMLAAIFPDAALVPEKFFGLTKSWMAIKSK